MTEPDARNVSDLIRGARQGDQACRDRLFAACRNYLALVARAHVESWLQVKVDASDLVQQTLLEAYRDFDRFQGQTEKEWLAWLRKILNHNAADFIRKYRAAAKRQVGREVPFRDASATDTNAGAPEPAAPDLTPSQEFFKLDMELRVVAALGELPPDYQEVILLRNLQRLPFDEVARRMDRSRPAAQMLWMRAIRRLREALDEEDEG